jgi:hypothetical protein
MRQVKRRSWRPARCRILEGSGGGDHAWPLDVAQLLSVPFRAQRRAFGAQVLPA